MYYISQHLSTMSSHALMVHHIQCKHSSIQFSKVLPGHKTTTRLKISSINCFLLETVRTLTVRKILHFEVVLSACETRLYVLNAQKEKLTKNHDEYSGVCVCACGDMCCGFAWNFLCYDSMEILIISIFITEFWSHLLWFIHWILLFPYFCNANRLVCFVS